MEKQQTTDFGLAGVGASRQKASDPHPHGARTQKLTRGTTTGTSSGGR